MRKPGDDGYEPDKTESEKFDDLTRKVAPLPKDEVEEAKRKEREREERERKERDGRGDS